jgi:hypothetical protein
METTNCRAEANMWKVLISFFGILFLFKRAGVQALRQPSSRFGASVLLVSSLAVWLLEKLNVINLYAASGIWLFIPLTCIFTAAQYFLQQIALWHWISWLGAWIMSLLIFSLLFGWFHPRQPDQFPMLPPYKAPFRDGCTDPIECFGVAIFVLLLLYRLVKSARRRPGFVKVMWWKTASSGTGNSGHLALLIHLDGVSEEYVSWYPSVQSRTSLLAGFLGTRVFCARGKLKSRVFDENDGLHMPSAVHRISSRHLDVKAIRNWFINWRENPVDWHTVDRNCSTLVYACLRVGGAFRLSHWAGAFTSDWRTPNAVFQMARFSNSRAHFVTSLLLEGYLYVCLLHTCFSFFNF